MKKEREEDRDDGVCRLVTVRGDGVEDRAPGRQGAEVPVDPCEHVMAEAGRVVEARDADIGLRERLLELTEGRRNREPEEHPDDTEHEEEEKEDRQRLGHLRRRSQSTPGRMAAANVSASSSRMTMLRTFQRPNATAPTAIAAAAALAAVRAMSRSPLLGGGLRSGAATATVGRPRPDRTARR